MEETRAFDDGVFRLAPETSAPAGARLSRLSSFSLPPRRGDALARGRESRSKTPNGSARLTRGGRADETDARGERAERAETADPGLPPLSPLSPLSPRASPPTEAEGDAASTRGATARLSSSLSRLSRLPRPRPPPRRDRPPRAGRAGGAVRRRACLSARAATPKDPSRSAGDRASSDVVDPSRSAVAWAVASRSIGGRSRAPLRKPRRRAFSFAPRRRRFFKPSSTAPAARRTAEPLELPRNVRRATPSLCSTSRIGSVSVSSANASRMPCRWPSSRPSRRLALLRRRGVGV